jgi:ABC-type dipeptide/oligopeptide/nickel transport system ATPase subunit
MYNLLQRCKIPMLCTLFIIIHDPTAAHHLCDLILMSKRVWITSIRPRDAGTFLIPEDYYKSTWIHPILVGMIQYYA